ncbi:SMI1/KNR4 family protein [Pseudonocardia oroxyli]|uniref:SMI1/KNR4 family protein n=1 Tax=Pseudonocardia oroxyli TaxID=366584 RepID=UPI000B885DE4|nr:SMI1/KNR4 family protein [Pseudonocardia oroxyli]
MSAVAEAMESIIAWCIRYAPETATRLRPPATRAEIDRAQAAVGVPWPDDLVELYESMDGTEGAWLWPGAAPLSTAALVETWNSRQRSSAIVRRDHARQLAARPDWEIAAEQNLRAMAGLNGPPEDPYDVDRHEAQPAGTPAGIFIRSFLPIANDGSGGHLIVDLRDGDERGSIKYFDKVDADTGSRWWQSVEHLVTDVADGLQHGRMVQPYWTAEVEDGHLNWEI